MVIFFSDSHHSEKCIHLADSFCFSQRLFLFTLVYQVDSGFPGFYLSFKPSASIHDRHVCVFSPKQDALRDRTACPTISSQPEAVQLTGLWCIQGPVSPLVRSRFLRLKVSSPVSEPRDGETQ